MQSVLKEKLLIINIIKLKTKENLNIQNKPAINLSKAEIFSFLLNIKTIIFLKIKDTNHKLTKIKIKDKDSKFLFKNINFFNLPLKKI